MNPYTPFGEHRGTGFAGPLVLLPVRGLADHTKWGSLGESVIQPLDFSRSSCAS